MSSVNVTNKLRLSCDTRWQPSDQPADSRFVKLENQKHINEVDTKFGLHAKNIRQTSDRSKRTIEWWRSRWGLPVQI